MTQFEDFFVSPSLKTRLLNSKTSTVTSGFSGMHEYPLKDLLAFNSEEIIASEYVKFLAKREHGQQKQKKPRYAVSIVQRSHFWTEAEKSPATSSALETVINNFFKGIFSNVNQEWIDISTKMSAFVLLHETTAPETEPCAYDFFEQIKLVACVAFFSTDENIFINCLAVNTIEKPKDIIKNKQQIRLPTVAHNSKPKTTSSTKWSSFTFSGIGHFMLSVCQAFATRVNLFELKVLRHMPQEHLPVWAQIDATIGGVCQFYNRNGFVTIYKDEYTEDELKSAKDNNSEHVHERVVQMVPVDLQNKIYYANKGNDTLACGIYLHFVSETTTQFPMHLIRLNQSVYKLHSNVWPVKFKYGLDEEFLKSNVRTNSDMN